MNELYILSLSLSVKHILAKNQTVSVRGQDLGEIAYGSYFRSYVSLSVCVQQLAVCTVFFSFIGDNVASIMRELNWVWLTDQRVVVTLVVPFAMALSCAPNLRALAPATATGTFFLFSAFALLASTVVLNLNYQHENPELKLSKVRFFSS